MDNNNFQFNPADLYTMDINTMLMRGLLVLSFLSLLSFELLAQTPSPPQTNTSNITNGCNASVKLSAYSLNSPSGLTHRWYLTQTGFQTIAHAVSSNTPPGTYATELTVTQTKTYWVAAISSSGQISSRTQVKVTFTTPDLTPPDLTIGYTGPQCGPTATFAISAGGGGNGSTYRWYASSNTSGTPIFTGALYQPTLTYASLVNGQKTYWVKGTMTSINCYSGTLTETKSIVVSFKPVTPVPNASNKQRCGPGPLTLTASGAPSGVSYRWYNPNGSIAQTSTSSSYTTPTLSATANYQVSMIVDGCEGLKKTVSAIINSSTAPPTVMDKENDCGINTITLDAVSTIASGLTHKWYTTVSGPNTASHQVTSTVGNYVTSIIVTAETKTYWVASVLNGCESNRVAITATFIDNSTVPTLTVGDESLNSDNCGMGTFILVAEGGHTGSVYDWYDVASNSSPIHTGPNYQPTISYAETLNGLKSFWVEGTLTNLLGCPFTITNRVRIDVFVDPLPNLPTAPTVSRCGPGTVMLTTSLGNGGGMMRWYDQLTSGTLLGTGNTFTTPSIANSATYYVESYNSTTDCSSERVAVLAEVLVPVTWYQDIDSDDFSPTIGGTVLSCDSPGAGFTQTVLPETDCNDYNAAIHPNTIWYLDNDYDNLGDPDLNNSYTGCLPPGSNYALNMLDGCPEFYAPDNNCTPPSFNPSDLNYVYTRAYQTEETSGTSFFTSNDNLIQSIVYLDGLGRNLQHIGIDQTPDKDDVIKFIDYDDFGRVIQEFLPYPETDDDLAAYRSDAKEQTQTFYDQAKYQNTTNPYGESLLESSPLNRVLKIASPGEAWKLGNGHETMFDYQSNAVIDGVRLYRVNLSYSNNTYYPTLIEDGLYPQGELNKIISYDENYTTGNDHSTEEYTDKHGRLILKRTYNNNDRHDTQYVYDDFGNLSYVLTPKMEPSTATLSEMNANMDALGFKYVYDHRNRVVIKKVPGRGEEYIVFNRLDQPIMTQDANQKANGEWLFTKYDQFSRVAYTGKAVDARNRQTIQTEVNALNIPLWVIRGSITTIEGVDIYYNNGAYPVTSLTEVLTINYYDSYNFDLGELTLPSGQIYDQEISTMVQGLITGTKTKVLETEDWITMIKLYDEKSRPLCIISKNDYLATLDEVKLSLDFTGRTLLQRSSHIRSADTIVTLDHFTYDHVGRLVSQSQCIGGASLDESCDGGIEVGVPEHLQLSGIIDQDKKARLSITVEDGSVIPENANDFNTLLDIDPSALGLGTGINELITLNEYDELGRMIKRKVGGEVDGSNLLNSSGLQTIDYNYNIRGWLMGINDNTPYGNSLTINANDLFGYRLDYTDPTDGTGLFNGNIAQTHWRSQNTDKSLHTYTYAYDALNRITGAIDNMLGHYTLSDLNYDKNGNIERLIRNGHTNAEATNFGVMDDLTYSYDTGNQLMKIADAAPIDGFGFKDDAINMASDNEDDYSYDLNGNMKTDANKGISEIEYNYLNLPKKITFSGGNTTGTIEYVYDATGVKLDKKLADVGQDTLITTNYAGNYIYVNDVLQFFNHPLGHVSVENGNYGYVYQYSDHLGNVRLSYADENRDGVITSSSDPNTTEIINENNYYPFGGLHKGYNDSQSAFANATAQKWKYNGMEYEDGLDLNSYDFGARNYDPWVGRWMNVDPLANTYEGISPYSYAFNSPVQAYDPDGQLIIFVNGLLFSDALEYKANYINFIAGAIDSRYAYNPSRRFWKNEEPTFNGTKIDYWGNIDDVFVRHFGKDEDRIYINGTDDFRSQGEDRFMQGMASAEELIRQLDSGAITLAEGETIKVIGHSQGTAFAAGMLSVLAQHEKYASKTEVGIYLSPHQPGEYTHPENIDGYQYSTLSDVVSSGGGSPLHIALGFLLQGFNGGSSLALTEGVNNTHLRKIHLSPKGGHDVWSWFDQLTADFPAPLKSNSSKSVSKKGKNSKDKVKWWKFFKINRRCKCR